MTQQERTQILQWISENEFRVLNDPSEIDPIVNATNLTAFIESLLTEEPQTLRDGDWCIIENTEQAKQLWLIQYPEIADNNFLFMQSMNSGSMGYLGDNIRYSISIQSRIRPLSFDLFYQYARNTFNTPKP